jgi:LuxR family maltose regulon positive regulatory protein
VSLDEEENAPRSFLTLLVAAIQIRFPDIGRATMALASASEFPDISHIQRQLVNDLDEIDEPFVLVLEDLHLVQDQRVMELLAGLLHHPPRHLHLMVLTRWDPVLPLGTLRAQGQLLEIGLDALRFTVEETTRYLDTVLGEEVDRKDAEALERSTEGWVTGIRLAALSIRDGEELARLVKRMEGSLEFISSYLMEEVLSGLPAPERSFLLQTSILDRFSGDLCDALWIPEGEGAAADEGEGAGNAGAAGETMRGEAFLDWAKKNQLFVVPLDLEGQWFRYHHLFQSLLQAELRQRSTPEKMTRLHLRASRWLADNDLPDEAIRHALAGGDVDAAVKVVEENRISLLDKGQWTKLSDWLGLLPQEVKDTRPHLLLARAWVADFRGRADEILPVLERLDGMVKAEKLDRTSLTETSLWRGYLEFWTGQPEASRRTLEGALCNAREMPDMVRAMAEVYSAFSIQATGGDIPKVIHRIRKLTAPNSDSGPLLKTRASLASVFVHLLNGQLKEAFHTGSRVRTLAAETDDSYVYLWSCYLRGNVAFHWFPADECCRLLGEVWQNRFNLERRAAADSMAALALSHQFLRCPSEAREVLRHAEEFAEWTRDPAVKERMASAHARIALLQGDLNRASAWEEAFEATPSSGEAVFWMENPFLTQCRVLLAQGSPENWLKALEQLRHLDDLYSLYHNECQRIEIGVLEAAALQKLGRGEEAVGSLTQVLGRAAPGRWIRPFVELGPPMAELLEEVRDRDVAVTQIQEILAAFQTPIPQEAADIEGAGPGHPKMASGVGQLLTEREVDVLFQLAKGYSNKAIARNLHLSVETVKKHLYNAFKKLNVNNRVAALAKAKELGLPFDE